MGCIYGLRDPETMELKYVGQTSRNAGHRLAGHVTAGAAVRSGRIRNPSKANRWLASLSGPPVQTIFEEDVPNGDLLYRERYWIMAMKEAGHNLVNGAPGRGAHGSWTDEQRARHSLAVRKSGSARKGGEATAAKYRGVPRDPMSEETRTKIRAARRHQVYVEASCLGCQSVISVNQLTNHQRKCIHGETTRRPCGPCSRGTCTSHTSEKGRLGAAARWSQKGGE